MTIILQTERLNITIPNMNSFNNRYKLLSDPEVSKFLGNGKPKAKLEVKEFLQKNIDHYQKHGFCLFDVFLKNTGEFIGDAGLAYEALNTNNNNIEVGYRLLKKYWNKGYATELARAFIKWGFNNFHFSRIVAYCMPNNTSSSHVMKKCNMKYRGKHLYDGKNECAIYYINNMVIETDNFYLRPFDEINDFDLSYNLWQSKDVLESMECKPCTKKEIRTKLARYKLWMEKFGFTNFAVFSKESDNFLGSCGISLFHDPHNDRNPLEPINGEKYLNRDVELGYVLNKKYWGKGYATELAKEVVNFVFDHNPDLQRIVAVTVPNNIASQKVLTKIGFEFVNNVNSKEYGREKFFILKKQK